MSPFLAFAEDFRSSVGAALSFRGEGMDRFLGDLTTHTNGTHVALDEVRR